LNYLIKYHIESFESDLYNSKIYDSDKSSSNILSTKKLQELRSKLFKSDNFDKSQTSFKMNTENFVVRENNFKPKESTYKEMLNRVREKSHEQASQIQNVDKDTNLDKKIFKAKNKHNKNHIDLNFVYSNAQSFQIVSNDPFRYDDKLENQFKSSNKSRNDTKKIDNEDEHLITILNTNNFSKCDFGSLRKIQELNKSSIDHRSDFYEENLFDLIEEMESKERISVNKSISRLENFHDCRKNENLTIDFELDKRYQTKFK